MKECSKCHYCYDDSINFCEFDNNPLMTTFNGSVIISGRYILEKRLGNGGMGVVFKARHKFLKSLYAIKIILPSLVEQDKNLLLRFKQEAVLAASIDHPNVVRVTDFGVEDEVMPYLVMEFVDGIPLSTFLEPNKPLTIKETLNYFQPIALGVAEAHRQGIIHRDLKPQNIMVQKNIPLKKAVKVLDFGLAKIKSSESFNSFVQTQANSILGSPPYMSPEQWENNQVDHRADIYGLGVILYQMLTGNLPFQADSIPAVMYQHLTAQPPAFATHGVSVPPEIENVARQALEKDREMRQASVEDMLKDFELAVVHSGLADISLSTMTPYSSRPSIHETNAQNDKTIELTMQLTDTQRGKISSYFDSSAQVGLLADEKLAHEFLDAKDRAEEAKAQASQADRLVQELAEAQKDAQEAQNKALAAKQRMEDEVRRRLEAEMENKLALEQQTRQKAEAERLAQEVEARKKAEERANYLAQAALEAQKVAEIERRKSELEAHQRELHESVRREAEIHSNQLAQQVAESKKQFEEARQQADYESRLRQIAEAKQIKVESEIQALAENEAERRKVIANEAQQQIQNQAVRFEKEAGEAQKRVEEARLLADFETQKREQAETLQKRAEEEARRLGDEIIRVQRQMQEIEQHKSIEPHSQSGQFSSPTLNVSSFTPNSEQLTMPVINLHEKPASNQPVYPIVSPSTQEMQSPSLSNPTYSGLLNTNPSVVRRKPMMMIVAGSLAALLVMVLGGFGFYSYFFSSPKPKPGLPLEPANKQSESSTPQKGNAAKGELILIEGGAFEMGRDVPNTGDPKWGNQFPAHTVSVNSFSIGKTEVSNQEYAEFVKDKNYQPPKHWVSGNIPKGEENYPVVNVSLADTKAYTDWYSKREGKQCRLPTEEEWEFAARNGSKQTTYPWGNEWQDNLANIMSGKALEVGTSGDETSVGVKDMMGNVAEWTSTIYDLYPKHGGASQKQLGLIIIRGSFHTEEDDVLKNKSWITTRRTSIKPVEKVFELGFRIVCQP